MSISGRRVIRELNRLIERRGEPELLVSDNGTEFTSNAVLGWVQERNLDWHYIAPGKPTQNVRHGTRTDGVLVPHPAKRSMVGSGMNV